MGTYFRYVELTVREGKLYAYSKPMRVRREELANLIESFERRTVLA
jgi:hypothetical protein